MSTNSDINLIDTLKIFKDNIKTFYVIMIIGFFVAIIGIGSNIFFNKPKVKITTKFFIINPFENFQMLDLLTLDVKGVTEAEIPEMRGIVDKIEAYEKITDKYVKLLHYHSESLRRSILDDRNYGVQLKKSASPALQLTMINVSDRRSAEEDIKRFLKSINNIVKPLVIGNYKLENEYLKKLLINEEFMGVTSNNFMLKKRITVKLNILYNTRMELLADIGNQDLKVFESTSTYVESKLGNTKIFISIMASFCIFFLLLVIIRKESTSY